MGGNQQTLLANLLWQECLLDQKNFFNSLETCGKREQKQKRFHELFHFYSFHFQRSPYVYFLNCGTLRNRFILRLNESRDLVERARESVSLIER